MLFRSPGAAVWVVETIVATDVLFPDGVSLPRPAFLETAWELLEDTGLLGIHEGTIDVADAFAAGLTDSTLVIDEAEAPPRDWVGARDLADVEFWFPSAEGAREAAARLVRLLGCALVGIRREAPRDWAAESRAAIGPVAVPRFGRIVPPWHADGDGAGGRGLDDPGITVVIDPGAGFGTGIHPTTRLCLSALADSAPGFRGGSVLDFGSGSGILEIGRAHV